MRPRLARQANLNRVADPADTGCASHQPSGELEIPVLSVRELGVLRARQQAGRDGGTTDQDRVVGAVRHVEGSEVALPKPHAVGNSAGLGIVDSFRNRRSGEVDAVVGPSVCGQPKFAPAMA